MSQFKKAFKISVPTVLILSAAIILFVAILDFSRITYHGVQKENCVNNLRQIEAAKAQWALENRKTNGEIVSESDLMPYIKRGTKSEFLKCPQGGIYTIGKIGEAPTCSLGTNVTPAHVLRN